MKAIIKNKEGYEIECKVTRDKNKLTLEFNNEHNVVPYPVIKNCGFQLELKPDDEEIYCGSCDTCLSPIC